MRRRLIPMFPLQGAQAAASDPRVHAALSASAGTGKTHVLTSRVLRLLLSGVAPSTILCLTFTKAGAAEMANRLGERLAHWVRLPDEALRKELYALGEDNDPVAVERARRLFAEVLDAPGGGLRIQTIHSFAQALLAAFPGEAGVTPGFRPIEGRTEVELAKRTLAALLEAAEAGGNSQLINDVSALSLRLGESGTESYLIECARSHEAMEALGDPAGIEAVLLELIGVKGDDPAAEIRRRLRDDEIDIGLIERLVAANRAWGTETGHKIVANLTAFLGAGPEGRASMLSEIGSGLVTGKGEPCKSKPRQVSAEPEYDALLAEFAGRLAELRALVCACELAKTQAAGLRAGQAFSRAYVRAKRAHGVADFDDLISWTRRLFELPGMGEWVRYKLDQRTDHILVDEAQDTNADQWAIVDSLAEEYFSGNAEAERRWRTLFMVGDYKQAIFGFQGTDPKQYEQFRQRISAKAAALLQAADQAEVRTREFRDLSIDASFRSSPPVLEVVDALIRDVGFREMGLGEPPNPHQPFHTGRPGRVELWPPFEPGLVETGEEGEEGWIDDSARLYADAIAQQVRQWLAEAPVMATTKQPLRPGDILILVRSRTEFASLIVARLYAQGVPVAGIDRLHLHKPLAVKDLLAAVTFAVQPLDDLNLANVLVSPLVGWTQDQLFELAHPRGKGVALWTELQRRRDEGGHFSQAHGVLSDWLRQADYATPARFLESILSGPLHGRRRLLRRLGEAARDPIEELVASALAFEREEIASLDGFLAWFGQGDVEVKRDPAAPSDAVRVMTVHGAKGLEAPLVILADATHDPDKVGGTSPVMDLPIEDVGNVPIVRPRKDECAPIFRTLIDEARRREQQEHWRLAYVGLTRAAERLVIAGVQPKRGTPELSWHSAASRAMQALGAPSLEIPGRGKVLVWETVGTSPKAKPVKLALTPMGIPEWLNQSAPIEARPPRPLAPSQIVEDRDSAPPPTPEMRAAARRGTLLHALFERLPGVGPADRSKLARKWLVQVGVSVAEAEEIAEAACSVIADPEFADLFGVDALAEAPIAATLADGRVIAGTVDRLCIGPDLVRVIDFKTGRSVPSDLASVPPAHRKQMEAYADALRIIFPNRKVEAALLYTAGPRLITLPG